jgi:hypothetical protein
MAPYSCGVETGLFPASALLISKYSIAAVSFRE